MGSQGVTAPASDSGISQGWENVDHKSPRGLGGRVYLKQPAIKPDCPGVFGKLSTLGDAGDTLTALLQEKTIKPQQFSRGLVFHVPGEKKPMAFLYNSVQGDGPSLYARKGTLKGVSPTFQKDQKSAKHPGEAKYKEYSVVPIGGASIEKMMLDVDEFVKVPFSNTRMPPKDIKLNHGYVGQVGYFTGDPWSIVANVDMFRPILENLPSDPGVMNKFTSTFGVVTGPISYLSALKGIRVARCIGDTEGALDSNIRLVRSGMETVSGATMIGVRTVGLIVSKATTSKTLLVANKVLGYASTITGSLLYLFLMIPFVLDSFRGGRFLSELKEKKSEGIDQAFMSLVEQVSLNSSDMKSVVKVARFDSPAALYDLVKDGETVPFGVESDLTKNEMEVVESRLRVMLSTICPDEFDLITDWDQVRNCLLAKMLKEANRLVLKKKSEYTRRASHGSYSDIRNKLKSGEIKFNMFGLNYDCLKDKVGFQHSIVALAIKEANSNLLLNTVFVFTCVIGIGSIIGATIFTGGAPLLASIIVMLVMNVIMAGLDLYSFIEELKAMKTTSSNDMITLAIFFVMTIFSLSVSYMFAGGPIARSVVIALGALMLAFQGAAAAYAYDMLDKKPKDEKGKDCLPHWHGRVAQDCDFGEDYREKRALEIRHENLKFDAQLRRAGFSLY